jgi:hypothetical protein
MRRTFDVSVVIQKGPSLIEARLRASLAELGSRDFVEGHSWTIKTAKRVPKAMTGKRLSQREATKLLAKLE